jgi:DNA topoisomerase-3
VKENYRRFACESCEFSITKIPGSRSFEIAEAEAFLKNKKIGPLEGFRSKAGWPFSAELRLVYDDDIRNWKLEFDFGEDERRAQADGEPVDFSGQASLGPCPKCKGHVYEHGTSYVCEHAVGPKQTCDFKSGKIILQQPVAHEQMHKLLAGGRTDLLDGFISNRTRRKFKAFLRYDPQEGKVVFEFEPRPQRGGKGPAKGAVAGAAGDKQPDEAPANKSAAVKTAATKKPAAKKAARKTSRG